MSSTHSCIISFQFSIPSTTITNTTTTFRGCNEVTLAYCRFVQKDSSSGKKDVSSCQRYCKGHPKCIFFMWEREHQICKVSEFDLMDFDVSCMEIGGPPSPNIEECLFQRRGGHCQVNYFLIIAAFNYIFSNCFMSQ